MKHPVMRYHGGKYRIAKWIIGLFPEHRIYVEPFGGAAGVLMQKPPSESEVYNDLDGEVSNVFTVLQDPEMSLDLEKRLRLTPYSRREFEKAYEESLDPVERARKVLIRAHMGFGSAGATKGKTGFRIDSARKYGTAAHLWARYPDEIPCFLERLRGVLIENRTAVEIINNHDREETLFYVDPPYMHSTRKMGSVTYKNEMTDQAHEELVALLLQLKGQVILSGYDNDLYSDMLVGWEKKTKIARISAGRGTGTREEVVWLNPACGSRVQQRELFAVGSC